jgi:Bacterial Ig-like domain (group 2)/Bacterial Ig-like domain
MGSYSDTAQLSSANLAIRLVSSDPATTVRDTAPPSVVITSGPTGDTSNATPSFKFTTDPSAVTKLCSIDNVNFTPCAPDPAAYTAGTALSDGPHVFIVKVTDAAGNTAQATRSFRVDSTVPIVDIVSGPAVTNNQHPTFSFTVTDSGVTTTDCSLTGPQSVVVPNCTSPFAANVTAEGNYTLTVFAHDAAGNTGTATRPFTVDFTAPTVTIAAPPVNVTVTTNSSPRFYFTSDDPSAATFCSVAGDPAISCASPFSSRTLPDGAYTFSVYARDSAGNIGPTATFAFAVDHLPPVVSIPVPPNITTTNNRMPSFTFAEIGPAGTAVSFQCRVDSGANMPCLSPFAVPIALADGSHTLTVTASDAAGNNGQASLSFTVDSTAPFISIPDAPSNSGNQNTATPTFLFQVSNTPSTTPVIASQCSVNDAAPPNVLLAQSPPNVICDTQFSVPLATALSDGAYVFRVTTTDAAGNAGQASFPFVVDTHAPVVTLSPANPTTFATRTPQILFSVNESPATSYCSVDNGAFAPCTSPFTAPTQLADGPHTFSVFARDAALNTGPTVTFAFVINTIPGVNHAPILDATKTPALASVNKNAAAPSGAVGTLVSNLVDFALPTGGMDNVTDIDNGALLGLAVVAADTTNGTWFYSTNNGATWSALGLVSGTSARLLAADAATRLYFRPNANFIGALPNAINFRAWDRTTGSNGASASTATNGGATAFSAATDTASLTVSGPVLVSIQVTPVNPTIPAGRTQQFTATGTFSDGSNQDLTALATWTSNNPQVAAISNANGSRGSAIGVTAGTSQMVAQLDSVSGSTTLTVTSATLVSISVTPANATLPATRTQQFTAAGTFSDGTNQDLTTLATWTSNSISVAKVSNTDGSKGLATGVATGAATIRAQYNGVVGSANITVTPAQATCTSASVLDNFNRANGALGSNWLGLTGTSFYAIKSNRLDVLVGGPVFWNAASFGTSQSAFATLSTVDTHSPSQGLLLKVQTGNCPQAGAIAVVYDATAHAFRVSTFRPPNLTWTPYASATATLVNGDKLGACVSATGVVTIYKNNVTAATVTLSAADKAFFNSRGGKIGLWTLAADEASFDDFGGGTVTP